MNNTIIFMYNTYFGYGSELQQMEAQHGVTVRWQPNSPEYVEVHGQFAQLRSSQLKRALWVAVVRRHFLLQMKAKYAG